MHHSFASRTLLLLGLPLLSACSFFEEDASSSPNALALLSDGEAWNDLDAKIRFGTASLSSLSILERDFSLISYYYVDSDQLKGQRLVEMLEMALELVEANVDEVQFIVQDDRVIGNVGTRTRTFNWTPPEDLGGVLQILQPIAAFLDSALPEDVDRANVEYLLLNGALSALDPHSILLPPVEAAEMEVDNQGEFGGLGIEISLQEGLLTVKQPIEGTPAWDAGLKSEDQIVRIEKTSTINMDLDEAVSLLRGKVGEPVTIWVMRSGWASAKPFTIVRGRIKIDPVKGELLDESIGYIKIQSFHQNVANDMEALLTEMQQEASELKGLVLDLRNNPGGYLNQAIKVSDKFIRNGVLVSTVEGAQREREETHAHSSNTLSNMPIVVLVNGNSASASEIVAGALRNQSRAVIIGERSFGKGSVQHLYGNPDDSRLKLTVAQYLTPGDQSIQSVGIPPDVLLKPSLIRPKTAEDEEMVSLYWREWVTREGDLDRHLNNDSTLTGDTKYSLRYLFQELEGKDRTDPRKDWEVQFAKDVLLNTNGSDRASVMLSVGRLIEDVQQQEEVQVQKAFQRLNIDWTPGVNHYEKAEEDLRVSLAVDGDALIAGEEQFINVELTNQSERSYHQVSAVLLSDNPSLNHREVYFGVVEPNQTLSQAISVTLPQGYGVTQQELQLQIRDPNQVMLETTQMIQHQPQSLPAFDVAVQVFDGNDGKGTGNGNGILEVDETILMEVTLTNIGQGVALEPYVRLKNRARRALDLIEGTLELGTVSEACSEENCYKELAAGESVTGQLSFQINDKPVDTDAWDVEILVGTNRSYDYSTAVLGGFSEYFQLRTDVSLPFDSVMDTLSFDQPTIMIEKEEVRDGILEISGYASDKSGITDVLIFQSEDKVYYKGESDLSGRVPFSTEIALESGDNPIYVLVKDNQGLHASKFLQHWYVK